MNLLSGFLPHLCISDPRLVNLRDTVKSWSKLTLLDRGINTDFRSFDYNTRDGENVAKDIRQYLMGMSMVCAGTDNDYPDIFVMPSKDGKDIDGWVEVNYTRTSVTVGCRAAIEEADKLIKYLEAKYVSTGALVKTITGIDQAGRLSQRVDFLSRDDKDLALQCFYPWLNCTLDEFYDAYTGSSENVLIIYGPAGLGKSTFLRTMIARQTKQAWLTYAKEVLEATKPMTDFFGDPKAKMFIMEDVDRYLLPREDGNDMMSMYLNATEGIIRSPEKKIVFSTNLSNIDRIDEALLRRGRCYDVIKFRYLTRKEKLRIEEEMGMTVCAPNDKDEYTLAEILNPPKNFVRADRTTRGPGFV